MTTPLPLRFALREMRAGLKGFYVFLACIAIGVGAIAGVNAVSKALTQGIEREGRAILGGDAEFSVIHRELEPDERAFLARAGSVHEVSTMRAMARRADGDDQALVELKAIDDAYPHVGEFVTDPPMTTPEILGESEAFGAAAAPELLDRLGLEVGERIMLGTAELQLRATIVSEPDALAGGLGFGPHLLISPEALAATGLVQPGSLVTNRYRVVMPAGTSDEAVAAFVEDAEAAFPQAGWRTASRSNASPRLSRSIERFAQFLTLVGLTALVVGGVGVANAVGTFVAERRRSVATLKCLGAAPRTVFMIYLCQVMLVASIGVGVGLLIGAAMPLIARLALADILPVRTAAGIYPWELMLGLVFGLLVALAFSLWPLGRAREIPASELFRDASTGAGGPPRWRYRMATLALVAIIAALAVWNAEAKSIALTYVVATIVVFAVLRLVASGLMWGAARAGTPKDAGARLALRNLHRPGALTPSVVLSLGLGLTLLVSLALIDWNLRRQISEGLPEQAPSFFFVDVQSSEAEAFSALLAEAAPEGNVERVPMLRGRVVSLRGIPAERYESPTGEGEWVLRGDRGLTYAATLPEGARIVDGEWWPQDHAGEPLVSFAEEEADELGLAVGDTLTVNVLGRNISARIANIRTVDWESLGINFVMVFSPNTFAGAPHTELATLTLPEDGRAEAERSVLTRVTNAYPTVTSVRVRDALEAVGKLVSDLGLAIRVAASVALVSSVLVLAGAIAAGHRRRRRDAVILKTLGATRARLLGAFAMEYGMLGLATGAFALGAGAIAAWYVVTRLMEADFAFSPGIAGIAVLAALAVTLGLGLAGTWRLLSVKPAPELRNL